MEKENKDTNGTKNNKGTKNPNGTKNTKAKKTTNSTITTKSAETIETVKCAETVKGTKITKVNTILLVLKYILSFIIPVFFAVRVNNYKYLYMFSIEMAFVAVLSNMIGKNKIGKIIHYMLFFMINIQMLILYFGNSYLSMIMLSNIYLINDLSDKKSVYIGAVLFIVVLTCIPLKVYTVKKKLQIPVLILLILAEIILCCSLGVNYSPYMSYYQLICDEINKKELQIESDGVEKSYMFYKGENYDYINRVELNIDKPNIILIITEGLSMNIIEDERNIMPNIKEYYDSSMHFSNYYNHTAATLRGIIGELYSGYQNENLDNNMLISLEHILSDNGYETTCINTEPANTPYTNYLENLGFDNIIGDESMRLNGPDDTMTDKDAYDLLYDCVKDNKDPFFTMMYTFGTHVSLDSPDNVFKDGKTPLLNKFYNLDCCFADFMANIKNDGIDENTIIIFTTDHATYYDNDFSNAFPKYNREDVFIDRIPLFIYYKGVENVDIDTNGRNSLDLSPTVLDLLDISQENYFLGESLFSLVGSDFSYISYYENNIFTTKDSTIYKLDRDEQKNVQNNINDYFIATKEIVKK